ncbi:hypothetical protein ACFSQ3_09000 [Sphingobacterium corticis]|uniref:Arm DNA-binding domain-containing protein n=1 Tax=Sphingobacterium corticis TaxID=1812823 RepID=A0ABW5NJI4_9SPHI
MVRSLKSIIERKETVYVHIVVTGQRTRICLKSKVSPSDWDHLRDRAQGRYEEIMNLNQYI